MIVLPFSYQPAPKPVTNGLVRYYDAEFSSATPSTIWTDLQNVSLAKVSSSVAYRQSSTGSVYQFPGTGAQGNVIEYGTNPFTGTTPHSIISWVYLNATQDGLISMVGANTSFNKIVMRSVVTTNALRLEFEGAGTNSTLTCPLNTWFQAAYVWAGPRCADIRLYLNQSAVNPVTTTTNLNLSSTTMRTGFQINGTHALNGKMGVYMAYNRTLTDAEVYQNYMYYAPRYIRPY